jgi:hypothetical protein
MRFATFTMSDDPRERVGVCTPDGTSLIDIAQVSEDAGRPRWGDIVNLIAATADGLPAWLRTLASSRAACVNPELVMMRLSRALFFGFVTVELPLPIVLILFTPCSGSGT